MAFTSMPANNEMPTWLRLMLGIVFVIAGFVVLGNLALATLLSVLVIGWCAIIAGIFEIVHAFWTKGWGGFVWQIILGLLYVAAGVLILYQPVTGVLFLTWLLGIFFIASGIVRIFVGFGSWAESGWLLLLSGIFGIIAGIVILAGWPVTGIWVIGFLLGIDLIFHGVGWLVFGGKSADRVAA